MLLIQQTNNIETQNITFLLCSFVACTLSRITVVHIGSSVTYILGYKMSLLNIFIMVSVGFCVITIPYCYTIFSAEQV